MFYLLKGGMEPPINFEGSIFWLTAKGMGNRKKTRESPPALPKKKANWPTFRYWVAVKELNSSYYIGGTLCITMYICRYTHYGDLV